ncbi:hypothetical protein ACFTAO_29375 [Paenibacillus rhizoplanae]
MYNLSALYHPITANPAGGRRVSAGQAASAVYPLLLGIRSTAHEAAVDGDNHT